MYEEFKKDSENKRCPICGNDSLSYNVADGEIRCSNCSYKIKVPDIK